MVEELADLPETCPFCGKPVEEWTENDGRGVIAAGVVYCSEACGLRDAAGTYAEDPDR